MKKNILFYFILIFLFIDVNGQISPSIDAQLQTTLDSVCNHYNIKGASAAVLVPNQGIWKGTYGISENGIPVTSDMLFGIGSNTKTYIATILLKMQEDNILDLDDTIGSWIQNQPNINGQITIRQLLNHTSGLYNYTSNPAFNNAINSNFSAVWQPEQILNYVNAPLFAPGSNWSYSNTNYLVAGLIIKYELNQNLNITLQNLLQPLNLVHTILYPEDTLTGPLAYVWSIYFFQPYLQDIISLYNYNHNAVFSMAWAAGGIMSTAEENVIFMNKLLSGQILTNSSIQEMKQFITLNTITGYGLGLFRRKNFNGRIVYGHGGTNLGFINENIVDSINGVTISVLTNQDSVSNSIILNQVVKALHQVTLSMPVSVEEKHEFVNITIFPNPAQNFVTISSDHYEALNLKIIDITGREIHTEKILGNLNSIDVSNFPKGIYVISISDLKNEKHYNKKLIIK